ncbi:MAG: MMPL family transporter [Pseudomonadota bacterium]|nr:MMPL family transporter [Pseudomonadota bacterium]
MADQPTVIAGATGWLAAASARRPVLVLVLSALLVALSAVFAVNHLRINTDNFDMISAEKPFRKASIAFRDAFPWYGDQLAVVLDAPTPEQAERAAAVVAHFMRQQPQTFANVDVPGGDPFFRRSGLLFLDTETLQDFLDRLASAQGLLAVLAEQPDLVGLLDMLTLALEQADPDDADTRQLTALVGTLADMAEGEPGAPQMLSWRRQLSVTGQRGLEGRRVVTAKPVQDFGSLSPAKAAIAKLRELAPSLGEGVRMRLTGDAALDTEELESVKLGGSTAGVLSGVGILLLLVIGLRRVRAVLGTLAVLVAGLVISLGFATLAVGQLNLLSVAFAVLFIGLAVDFSIHYTLRVRELGGGAAAVGAAGRSVGPSLALGALAAAIGFLSFLPTDYRGLAELGIIAGGSMVVALLLNLTLLPALLSIGARPVAPPAKRPDAGNLWLADNARTIVLAGMALGIAGLVLTPFVRFDFNPLHLKDAESESVSTFLDLAAGQDAGAYAMDALVPDADAAYDMAMRLKALPEVGRVLHLGSFVPADQEDKLAAIEQATFFLFPVLTAEALPTASAGRQKEAADAFAATAAELAATKGDFGQAALRLAAALQVMPATTVAAFGERVTGLLPDWLADIRMAFEAGPVTEASVPAAIRERWVTADGRYRLQVFPDAPIDGNDTLRAFADAVQAVLPAVTGAPAVVTAAGQTVLDSFRVATVVAAVAVVLLIAVLLRSAADMLLTLLPLALSALITLGAAMVLGEALNFANVIVLPLLFGLGVASSIHLVVRRREVEDAAELMRSSTPRAVLFSVLTTLASFGGLAASPHLGMASMGRLLTIAILATLFATLMFLPALIQLLPQSRK